MTKTTPATKAIPAAAPALALDDIRRLAQQDLPPLDLPAPPEALGGFAPLWQWMTGAQNKAKAVVRHPRIALFLSAHGAHPDAQRDIAALPGFYARGGAPLAAIAAALNADLQVYELDLGTPTVDFRAGEAMTAENAVQAIAYGMMAVQPGVDFLILGAPNPVAMIAAAEIRAALAEKTEPLAALLRFGGFDLAACLGAALAARLARVPVLLDDSAAAVLPLLAALHADAGAHARLAQDILPQDMPPQPGLRAALALGLLQPLTQAV